MRLSLFDYDLPQKLIAQKPETPRDHSRLLVFNRKTKKVAHDHFYNLTKYLTPNDVLVFNDTKVFPARLIGNKETGGKAEALLLKDLGKGEWEAMVGTSNPKIGTKLRFAQGLTAELMERCSEKSWRLKFNKFGGAFHDILNQIGQTPLPPYIKHEIRNPKSEQARAVGIAFGDARRNSKSEIGKSYQTVYARELGSAAAPTAGLHFTKNLLNKIKRKGCEIEFVTLHVGLGTFNPVNTERIEDYKIHSEWSSVDVRTMKRLVNAKQQGKRIIAVGTTSTRVLEYVFNSTTMRSLPRIRRGSIVAKDFKDDVSIFIYPGYKFKFVDAMITNFHLPKSTLLMLVSAFIGRKKSLELYRMAIKLKYRFFSFGDGMLLT